MFIVILIFLLSVLKKEGKIEIDKCKINETFAVYRGDFEGNSTFIKNMNVCGVSIPLDESEAITIFKEIYRVNPERYVIKKTEYGWVFSHSLGGGLDIVDLFEKNRTVIFFPGE